METWETPLVEDWEAFLAPYYQAIEELKIKLKGIRRQYRQEGKHAPIEFITGRVKTPESIVEKMQVRNIPREEFLEGVQDIAGLRIMCQFVDDIYEVVRLIRQRNDFDIVIERDYIQNKKSEWLSFVPYCIGISSATNRRGNKSSCGNSNSYTCDEFLGND